MTNQTNENGPNQEGLMVNIDNLSSQELNALIVKLEEDINQIQGYLNALCIALERFQESMKALTELNKSDKIHVPLTSLVYVPGKLIDSNRVIVSVGTGYYVEMTLKQAEEYYGRKVSNIEDQMGKLKAILSEKNKQINQSCSYLNHELATVKS